MSLGPRPMNSCSKRLIPAPMAASSSPCDFMRVIIPARDDHSQTDGNLGGALLSTTNHRNSQGFRYQLPAKDVRMNLRDEDLRVHSSRSDERTSALRMTE